MSGADGTPAYGTPEHAACEALTLSIYCHDGFVTASAEDIAACVMEGLSDRGFLVGKAPRCYCGWTGTSNRHPDSRMGRTS